MTRTNRLKAMIRLVVVVPVALLVSAIIVGTASYSAFSASTANPVSSWATGTVDLSDDDAASAMFSATALKPGSTGSKCITVTSTGSLASTVKLYGTGATSTNGLASHITVSISQGTGGSFGSCSGYVASGTLFSGSLAAFGTSATNWATGVTAFGTTGATAARTFQITYTVDADAPNSTQNGTAGIAFVWEAQNN